MREKSIMSRRFMAQNKVFADVFNYHLYQGRQVIKESDLKERDSTEVAVLIQDEQTYAVEKIRDILKECVIKTTDQAVYLMLGIENQSELHYAMPVRKFLYDALNYTKQVEEIAKQNIKQKRYRNGAEYLSGFRKEDKLKPVITLVIYWGADVWDAPRSLHEMLDVDDPELLQFVDDYKLKLIVPGEITDFEKFHSDARYVLEFIGASKDKEKLQKIMSNPVYEQLDNETAKMINCFTGANIKINKGKGVSNVCLAIKQMLEEEREKVRNEEREKSKQECLAIKQMLEEEREKVRNEEREKSKQECLAIKQMLEEEREKARNEEKQKNKELVEQGRIELMKNLVNKGKVTLEDAAEELGITAKQFEQQFLTN